MSIKIITLLFSSANSQMLTGSQIDPSGHNCVIDGGYQWCESTQSCIRQWETPCDSLNIPSPSQACNYPCPPSFFPPCPEPYIPDINNCHMITNNDNCGCAIGCPHYDCTNPECSSDLDCHINQFCRSSQMRLPMVNGRRTQKILSECVDKVGINETCGGFTPPEFQSRCLDNLECVNTMGPMIADAPGQCKEPCPSHSNRDEYGNCVISSSIPDNCATYFDGCNTCQVRDGRAELCTLMYCFTQNTPYCMNYHVQSNSLQIGDICYRFCEDNSEESINRKKDCPINSICQDSFRNSEVISFDSCNDRSWTCQILGH